MEWIMARDQFGNYEHNLDAKHPRKSLLERLGSKFAQKIFRDYKNGETKHIGYIIGGRWFVFCRVTEWEGK